LALRHQLAFLFAVPAQSSCIFEHVYFSRPDSLVFGRSVDQSRDAMGRQLAREAPVDADVVVPVPDSGNTAAIGYAAESGIRFGWASFAITTSGALLLSRNSRFATSASNSSSMRFTACSKANA